MKSLVQLHVLTSKDSTLVQVRVLEFTQLSYSWSKTNTAPEPWDWSLHRVRFKKNLQERARLEQGRKGTGWCVLIVVLLILGMNEQSTNNNGFLYFKWHFREFAEWLLEEEPSKLTCFEFFGASLGVFGVHYFLSSWKFTMYQSWIISPPTPSKIIVYMKFWPHSPWAPCSQNGNCL